MVTMVDCQSHRHSPLASSGAGARVRARVCMGTCHATMLALSPRTCWSVSCKANMVFTWHPHGLRPWVRNLLVRPFPCEVKDLRTLRARNLNLFKVAGLPAASGSGRPRGRPGQPVRQNRPFNIQRATGTAGLLARLHGGHSSSKTTKARPRHGRMQPKINGGGGKAVSAD